MLKRILFFLLIIFCNNYLLAQDQKPILIMIDPAGHAKNVGRRLVEGYERGETFKFAEKLQEELQKKYNVRVVLTRYPGEEIVFLQNASFANRLNIDFYLSLHIYREESVKPKIYMYHLIYDSLVDSARRVIDPFTFIPIYQAHFVNIHNTKSLAQKMKINLIQDFNQKRFDFYGPFGIPFKPLCGIVAPALAIEVGICEEDKWKSLVEPVVASLAFLGQNNI